MSFGHICIVALLFTGGAAKDQACFEDACVEDEGPDLSELMQLGAAVRKGQNSLITEQASIDRMLDQVQHLGDKRINGQLPPAHQEQMTMIKEFMETTLFPSLTTAHSEAESELQTLVAAFSGCNENGAALHGAIGGSGGVGESVDGSRASHATCRGDEADKLANKTAAGHDLLQFLQSIPTQTFQLNVPQEVDPLTVGAEAGVAYLQTIETRLCGLHDPLVAKKRIYDDAASMHTSAAESCNNLQAQFEQGYCAWRVELTDACNTLTSCYGAAVEAYTQRSAAIQTLEAQLKTEFTGIEKILCFVDIWMSDNNVTTVSDDKLAECHNLHVDTSPMNMTYPTAPPQGPCETSQVEQYPGTDAFRTSEYDQFSVTGVAETVACSSLSPPVPTTTTTTTTTTTPDPSLILDSSAVESLISGSVSGLYQFGQNGEGITGTSIADGGNDMYDGGNQIFITLTPPYFSERGMGSQTVGPLNYFDQCNTGMLQNLDYYTGAGELEYYTCKMPSVWIAQFFTTDQAISGFRTAGFTGADNMPSSRANGGFVTTDAGDRYGFFKTVGGTSDPSINHLVIVEGDGMAGWDSSYSSLTDDDVHSVEQVQGDPYNVKQVIYLLWAKSDGASSTEAEFRSVLAGIHGMMANQR